MNNYLRAAGVVAVALCAVNAQAYKYSVVNHTANEHEIFVRFQGVFGLGEDEAFLGKVKGKGGTLKDIDSGRLLQCIMPQLRIDKSSVAMLSVTKSQLSDMLMLKDDPKMLNKYIENNEIRPETLFLCRDRTFIIFQGESSASYIVVTLKFL